MNRCYAVLFLFIIGFTISEINVIIAQPSQLTDDFDQNNSTLTSNTTDIKIDSEEKRIILTWLKSNGTESDLSPAFIIDKRDFWNIFSQLFEASNNHNTTISLIE